jgi:L-fuculokinase
VWLKENHPQRLERAHAWLFISSLINHRLTGEFTTDITMAGTSQMLDIHQRDFSAEILQATGLPRRLFPRLVNAGEQIGTLQPDAANLLGLPAGLPVISAGHDTQFALFGAGAGQDEPVLSSGTWEILMVRSAQVNTPLLSHYTGSTCELDSQPGLYNPGMQWLASGVLEWVRKLLWTAETPWQTLIDEARAIPAGAQGVKMQCDLLACQNAGWQGVTLNTTRGHFYRAALEGLTEQLQRNLQTLEKIGHFNATELLLVGGGSRNTLWNQIKANMLDIPVKVLDDAETTVAGAAMFGWYGVGEFSSPEQARAQVSYQYRYFWPQTEPELIERV